MATYITTSIDGGNTFSPQTYANPSQTAIDAITGQTDVLGPEADNQSAGNRSGGHDVRLRRPDGAGRLRWPGLSGLGGQLQSELSIATGTVVADPLNIWYRPMVIAAGPRIINSTMGPIPLAEAASGSVSISVTFDRPVTATTFVTGDVQVFYPRHHQRRPLGPAHGDGCHPGAQRTHVGYTQFTITFDPTPTGANPATYNYTGTYSYLIAPDNGSGTAISSPIESYGSLSTACDAPRRRPDRSECRWHVRRERGDDARSPA